jgi:hypothetical protein
LIQWQCFWSIEPPLAERIELAIGLLASLTANINRDSKRKPEPYSALDWMSGLGLWEKELPQEEESEVMTAEALIRAFDSIIEKQPN